MCRDAGLYVPRAKGLDIWLWGIYGVAGVYVSTGYRGIYGVEGLYVSTGYRGIYGVEGVYIGMLPRSSRTRNNDCTLA